ncbi:MAG: hypothetical protein P8X42_14670, partial [Calditrichaceae bacterium]
GEINLLLKWFFTGYLTGYVFVNLYNAFLFVYIRYFNKRILKISFAYDEDSKFNIIKSPKPGEAVEIKSDDGIEPLYNYNRDFVPANPYTILFVANPKICTRLKLDKAFENREDFYTKLEIHRRNADSYLDDPIIKNKELFYRSIDRALYSFENDSVLGHPGIWSGVRIVTIFDKDIADVIDESRFPDWTGDHFGFAEAYQANVSTEDMVFDNLLVPLPEITQFLKDKLPAYQTETAASEKITFDKIDVIFILSANEKYDRSSAMFADKPGSAKIFNNDIPPVLNLTHAPFSDEPGIAAINVYSAWQKTFIHEYAHAMSEFQNGAIVDEYFDYNEAVINPSPELQPINRRERSTSNQPIPVIYAKYKNYTIHSDREHPSERENWRGYFPERWAPHIGCTMDRYTGFYKFDKLISDFMHDRLMAKINRP